MRVTLLTIIVWVLANPIATWSQETSAAPLQESPPSPQVVSHITVAIIDFESKAPGNPDLGSQLGDILSARLSIYDQFRLVDRKHLSTLLQEHALNLSGMVNTREAIKVGDLAGAQILIFGRAFTIDRDLYIVAKIVGTETSRVKGVMAKGNLESEMSPVIDQVVDNLANGLDKWATELLPRGTVFQDRLSQLKQALAQQVLPSVYVEVPEDHVGQAQSDPAVQTEVKHVLKAIGFPVTTHPKHATILIGGEAVSEFGARIGGLVSCSARAELQATARESGKVLAVERTTRRGIDLSETMAAKTALQAAGRELALVLAEKLSTMKQDPQQ
jgi:hypothetical protein